MREDALRPLWHVLLKKITPYALLIVAVFVAYANVYTNAFLYDDNILIVRNDVLRNWHSILFYFTQPLSFNSGYYRPFQTLLYVIFFHSAGLSLFAFHFLNIVLHAANACLVLVLGRELKFSPVACFLAALIWALHPLQTEAVTYMSATADGLSAFFCLMGAVALFPDCSAKRIAIASLWMICGVLSKESACAFPLLAASCLYFQNENRMHVKTYLRLWPLVLVAASYIGLRFVLMPPQIVSMSHEIAVGLNYAPLSAFMMGLKLLIWPVHLHMGYELPFDGHLWQAKVLVGIAALLLIITRVVGYERKENITLNWGLFWFTAAYAPSFVVDGFFYEHWLYLPSVGLFLAAAQSLYVRLQKTSLNKIKQATCVLASLVVIAMGVLTYRQNEIWADPITFYNNVFAQGERAPKIHYNLGLIYAARGDTEQAMVQYRMAIQNADDRFPFSYPHVNLASALMNLPDGAQHIEEAKSQLQQAIKIDPDCFVAFDDLAVLAEQEGDTASAALYRAQSDKIRETLHITPEIAASLSKG